MLLHGESRWLYVLLLEANNSVQCLRFSKNLHLYIYIYNFFVYVPYTVTPAQFWSVVFSIESHQPHNRNHLDSLSSIDGYKTTCSVTLNP